jgi:hypothetical protein
VDARICTPSDYGVMAKNIPLNMTREELKDYIEAKYREMHVEMNVVYVNYCYDISDLMNLT